MFDCWGWNICCLLLWDPWIPWIPGSPGSLNNKSIATLSITGIYNECHCVECHLWWVSQIALYAKHRISSIIIDFCFRRSFLKASSDLTTSSSSSTSRRSIDRKIGVGKTTKTATSRSKIISQWWDNSSSFPEWRGQGTLKGEVSLYRWPPVWLVWNQLHDNWQFSFLFAKQIHPNRSNRRSTVQWYFPL